MAGAGVLPGRAAAEAARQGWRVVALAFDHAVGLEKHVERVVPSSLTDVHGVLRTLTEEGVQAALFVGKFWKQRVFDQVGEADDAGLRLARGGLSDEALAGMVVTTLAGMGIERYLLVTPSLAPGYVSFPTQYLLINLGFLGLLVFAVAPALARWPAVSELDLALKQEQWL